MKSHRWVLILPMLVTFSLVFSACTTAAPKVDEMMAKSTPIPAAEQAEADTEMEGKARMETGQSGSSEEMMGEETDAKDEAMLDSSETDKSTGSEMAGEEDKMITNPPAFFGAEIVDASTGETFRLEDFKGKVVLVETMAIWCSNCLKQQKQVAILHELLGERDDFASVALDIDLNESLEDLKSFVDYNGFDWRYAVATRDLAREISRLYGDQFLNPPSTPMFIIDRQGQVHKLPFGIKSAEDLQVALQPFFVE